MSLSLYQSFSTAYFPTFLWPLNLKPSCVFLFFYVAAMLGKGMSVNLLPLQLSRENPILFNDAAVNLSLIPRQFLANGPRVYSRGNTSKRL
jgi:hypothetical protein